MRETAATSCVSEVINHGGKLVRLGPIVDLNNMPLAIACSPLLGRRSGGGRDGHAQEVCLSSRENVNRAFSTRLVPLIHTGPWVKDGEGQCEGGLMREECTFNPAGLFLDYFRTLLTFVLTSL